jgi:capsular polysaccharide biosynthesis protein
MAPHNWFHWIIDNLSTLYQARFLPDEFNEYPLVVPLEAKKRENWLAALDIVSAGREIVFVEGDHWFQVDDLVRIEGVTRPNPRLLSRQRARIGVMAAPLLDYRNFVLAQLGLDLVGIVPGRRLFIGRKSSGARGYNQEELFTVAEAYGFERVFLEDLTFEDSIRVFREAELIAGPHGAGWANMLFCHPATKAMLWTWEGEEEDNWYENIAFVAAVDYLQLSVSLVDKRGLDGRVADYYLDTSVFEQGLRALLARPSSVARR